MLRQVDRVIGTELPVHIHGESGTGKELIARAIHHLGSRMKGPFVPQNCTAIPPTLFESELFGHERGAFTGAMRATEGLFRRAHGGTLFLDEIGDLPLELQAKLLRVLETGEVRPVGATRNVSVDVRIVSATHRDLADLIRLGRFREDLYYRLNVIRIDIPPLRDRPEDIPVLVDHFLAQRPRLDGRPLSIDDRAMRALVRFDWPGNVRQLENELARAGILAEGGVIALNDLSPEIALGPRRTPAPNAAGASTPSDARAAVDASRPELASLTALGLDQGQLKDRVDKLETLALRAALTEAHGNKSEVARVLGLSRAGLNLKLRRLGLWDGE
jgi:two-component system response regulator PilR (NtrC family)